MNKITSLLKTVFILFIMWFSGFSYYKYEINPYPVKDWRLVSERVEASFLNLNETVLSELEDKQNYDNIKSVDSEELWKEWLFEEIEKDDYTF